MANSTNNVTVGKPAIAGAVYAAAKGTSVPTDATTAVGSTFKALGYISEDGLVNSNSPETDSIKAWGGDTVLTFQTAKEDTFKFTLLEAMNTDVLKLVYGDSNVTGASTSAGIKVTANGKETEAHAYVFDMVMNGGVLKRICVPNANITEIGDINYQDEAAVGYEITITALPDANGNTHYEYIKTPSTTS